MIGHCKLLRVTQSTKILFITADFCPMENKFKIAQPKTNKSLACLTIVPEKQFKASLTKQNTTMRQIFLSYFQQAPSLTHFPSSSSGPRRRR